MLNLGPVSHTCMINLSQVTLLLIVITGMLHFTVTAHYDI